MALKKNACSVCGGQLKQVGEIYKCMNCDSEFHPKEESLSPKEQEMRLKLLNAVEDAERKLRLSPPQFDQAEYEFREIINEYPDRPEGYWGLVRAIYGIKFERDSKEKTVPSCYKSVYEDFRNSDEYKKALSLADADTRAGYEKMAQYISSVAKEWIEKTQKYNYDIFISFKASDENQEETPDSREMQNLYTYLTENKYKVFFSPVTLRSDGYAGEKSEPYIFNALDKAQVLIVYGSKSEYFTSTWVQNEWQRYLRRMEEGEKPKNSLLVLYNKVNPKSLPSQLREIQALDYDSKTVFPDILKAIEGIFARLQEQKRVPIIQRVKVERIKFEKTGTVGERIGTVELGRSIETQGKPRKLLDVKMRTLGESSRVEKDSQDDLQTAIACMKTGAPVEARLCLDECIKKDSQNGDVWLVKLCLDNNTPQLYDVIKGKGSVKDFKEPIKSSSHGDLQKCIDYAMNKETAEALLSFVYSQIENIFANSPLTLAETERIWALYLLCGDYDSAQVSKIQKLMCSNVSELICSETREIRPKINFLLAHIGNVEELISTLKEIVKRFVIGGKFESAKYYNAQLFEYDKSDGDVLLNQFLIDNRYFSADDFVNAAKDSDITLLEKNLETIKKEDAEKILKIFCCAEKNLLNSENYDVALKYFNFVTKYNFKDRDKFICQHKPFFSQLAMRDQLSFFEAILAVYPDRSANLHVKSRCLYAAILQEKGEFFMAATMYDIALGLDENDNEALQGKLMCALHFDGKNYSQIRWDAFDEELFKKILASCGTQAQQNKFVAKICSMCVEHSKGTQ